MRSLLFWTIAILLAVTAVAQADTIYLKTGKVIQAENVQVTEDKVSFTLFGGRMSIAKNLVQRIERNQLTSTTTGFRSSISGTPYNSAVSNARSRTGGGDEGGGGDQADRRSEILQNFIDIKLQLQRELQFADNQIQTLRSVIYAKSAINSDTTEERQRLQEFEQQKQAIEAQLNQLVDEARRTDLLPADIRQLEQASITGTQGTGGTINMGNQQLQQPQDPRDATRQPLDEDIVTDDDDRNSSTVLEEPTEDDTRSRK